MSLLIQSSYLKFDAYLFDSSLKLQTHNPGNLPILKILVLTISHSIKH